MRPSGKWQKTASPKLRIVKRTDNAVTIALECETEGASIAYRIDAEKDQGRWQLYTQPVTVRKGETLVAKACRLGCLDSDEVRWQLGEQVSSVGEKPEPIPNWKAEIDQSCILEKLLQLKMLDGRGEMALPDYLKALKDEHPAVRYWAIVGIHRACKDEAKRKQLVKTLQAMLKDPSPCLLYTSPSPRDS